MTVPYITSVRQFSDPLKVSEKLKEKKNLSLATIPIILQS